MQRILSKGLAHRVMIASLALAALASTPLNGQVPEAQTLEQAYRGLFRVGVALNAAQIDERDRRGDAIIKTQFNTISPENALKWQSIHPEPERYNFELADRYVDFGERNGMLVVGHCLVWHSQVPRWCSRMLQGTR